MWQTWECRIISTHPFFDTLRVSEYRYHLPRQPLWQTRSFDSFNSVPNTGSLYQSSGNQTLEEAPFAKKIYNHVQTINEIRIVIKAHFVCMWKPSRTRCEWSHQIKPAWAWKNQILVIFQASNWLAKLKNFRQAHWTCFWCVRLKFCWAQKALSLISVNFKLGLIFQAQNIYEMTKKSIPPADDSYPLSLHYISLSAHWVGWLSTTSPDSLILSSWLSFFLSFCLGWRRPWYPGNPGVCLVLFY